MQQGWFENGHRTKRQKTASGQLASPGHRGVLSTMMSRLCGRALTLFDVVVLQDVRCRKRPVLLYFCVTPGVLFCFWKAYRPRGVVSKRRVVYYVKYG